MLGIEIDGIVGEGSSGIQSRSGGDSGVGDREGEGFRVTAWSRRNIVWE